MPDTELPQLLEALRSADRETRRAAARCLAETGAPYAGLLVPHLMDDDARFRFHVQRTLLVLGEAGAMALSQIAELDQKPLRYFAITTLARMDPPIATASLRRLVEDADPVTRDLALIGWVHCGAPGLADLLGEMLQHPELEVRRSALAFLPRLDRVHALTLLLDVIHHNEEGQGLLAVEHLLTMAGNKGLPRQIVVDLDVTLEQRYWILDQLYQAPTAIANWAPYDNIVMRDLCSQLLGGPPFRTLREILRDLERDDDDRVRHAAKALVAWRDLPRPSERHAQREHLLRAVPSSTTSPESLLRAGEEPETAAASTFWQRLRARFVRL